MRTTQMAQMADECRAFTTGFNQTRMICAKAADHVDTDPYHHDPFHNVTWREIDVHATPEEIATRVRAYTAASTCECGGDTVPTITGGFDDQIELPLLRSSVVYIRPIKSRPTLGNWLRGLVFA